MKAEKGVENGSAKWALPKDDGCNGNPKLSQILEEDKGSKEAKRKQSLRKPETKVMTCSWGRDALPSEQSKNQSIAEIQQEEKLLREHDEILEIEVHVSLIFFHYIGLIAAMCQIYPFNAK